MDDTTFAIDQSALATASARFPARRLAAAPAEVPRGLSYLSTPSDFGVHAWDENGHY